MASDLRFVTAVLKLVTNLERVGDLAETISRRTLELNRDPPLASIPALGASRATHGFCAGSGFRRTVSWRGSVMRIGPGSVLRPARVPTATEAREAG